MLSLPRTRTCFQEIEDDAMLDYNLPKAGMLAGHIMKHCCQTIDSLLERHAPCIYKVGYTHDAKWRMHNESYGYRWETAKWSQLIVIYAASETISPAFVEGALIQRHKGTLNENGVESKPCSI